MPYQGAELYSEEYYKSHCGSIPYDRSQPHWLDFFGHVADDIIRIFQPRRVFDAGCAHGFLLEALWDRGVETWGRDVSDFAISQVRVDVRAFCEVGSIAEPIEGSFDLVTCIEVLEHMTEAEGAEAIAVMTAAAPRIVFSSSPTDLTEPTHINVKPPIYWMRAFAKHNFQPVIAITLNSITPYALVFERHERAPDEALLLACAEIVRSRMRINADYHAQGALRARLAEYEQLLTRRDETAAAEREQAAAEREQAAAAAASVAAGLRAARDAVERRLDSATQTISNLEQMVAALERTVDTLEQASLQHAQERARSDAEIVGLLAAAQDLVESERRSRADYQTVVTSTTWRSTSALRSAVARLPQPLRTRARQALKLVYWSATLKLGRRLRERRQILAQAAAIGIGVAPSDTPHLAAPASAPEMLAADATRGPAHDPVDEAALTGFDADYYLRANSDVAVAGIDPARHYLAHGRAEGRHPNAAAALAATRFRMADLCDPEQDEPGPRSFDEAFCISVLTPTYNTEPRYLRELYQTLRNQQYSHWEWVIADDGSTDSRTVATVRALADGDPRIRLTLSPVNLGISGASNLALASVRGTHVALVDHDDLVSRDAFLALYRAWQRAPATQLFFTDECKLLPDGQLGQFWPKPDWSPAYLENTMCVGHLSVYEASFLRALGGFRSPYDGTQDFDLALRASLAGPAVVHVPIFAYLWRIIPGSAATDINEKHYAIERQARAVLDYARHKHPGAKVDPGWGAGYWRVGYPLADPAPLLSFVIPTGGGTKTIRGERRDLVLNCIRSFEERRFYPNREYIVIHNGDLTPPQVSGLGTIAGVRLVHYDAVRFNFSEKLNLGVASARGEYLCLLNDDVEAITPEGGEDLVSYLAVNPGVGAIGPLCLYEDGTIQQNGIVLTTVGPAHAGDRQPANFGGHQAMLNCRRESFCIGGAMMVVRKATYDELGGFDTALPLNYNDVDFGVRMRERGLTCVVDPDTQVYHYEGATKIGTSTVERERLFLKHPDLSDPYFSHWFAQNTTTYQLDLKARNGGRPFDDWLDRHVAARAQTPPERGPRLSVCVSVYNQPKRLLEEMYNSVLMQTYPHKEFVIYDDGSTDPDTVAWIERVRAEGQAVVERNEQNRGIDAGNRRLLEMMTGDFFVAVDADDFLCVDALQVMADAIVRHPGRKMFYSDEFKADLNSSRSSPFYKPDFDPVLLTNCCYPAHLMAMDATFQRSLRAYDEPKAAWSHDYDTLTRALAIGEEPVHVRELLYAWRIHPGSTASAATSTKPLTVNSQRFVLERLLAAKDVSHVLGVEPNTIESSSGMWRLRARKPVDGIRRFSAEDVWGEAGMGVAGLAAAAETAAWIAILAAGDPDGAMLELSAPAWFDRRVVAVGGILVDPAGTLRWSGGLFLPHGRLFDPYATSPLAGGGYHAQLWCQRCVDILAPVGVLIRADALRQAAGQATDADSLMAHLGLAAHQAGNFLVVTPHLRAPPPAALPWLPLDRAGVLHEHPALTAGSRWYDPRLETDPPYTMPGLA